MGVVASWKRNHAGEGHRGELLGKRVSGSGRESDDAESKGRDTVAHVAYRQGGWGRGGQMTTKSHF